jgi:hypothetical protein
MAIVALPANATSRHYAAPIIGSSNNIHNGNSSSLGRAADLGGAHRDLAHRRARMSDPDVRTLDWFTG